MNLTEAFKGTTMETLKTYIQQHIDRSCRQVWEMHLPEIEKIFSKGGDSAYGFFCRKLFEPLVKEMVEAGFTSQPVLPGAFPQSEEHWGPWEDRERRFWSVIHQDNGQKLGTLVFRIFHDHTRLRLPRLPQVYVIRETEPERISHSILHADPESGNSIDGGIGTYE
ncbi:DUF6022 family protein [Paenibacillus sp. NPDC056579]|uniref:DUF6022 family protein n=1 Tax=unclassified Paenibacillus TaxID=185978 RepID=UPI001EF8E5A1|nr:DUF6022 family protein [Paenibacillus sp. H1-7]ULL18288.1 hypothetical protein DVH26_29790 [Paenibacillus sp. H1-7]